MIIAATLLAASTLVTRARYAMGTICEITAPAAAAESAFAEGARVENLLTTWRDDSELARLNATGSSADRELSAMLASVVAIARETDGAFNPLVAPLIDAWGIRDGGALPSPETVRTAVERARVDNISFDATLVRLRNGARVEEGGFGKGYALDRMLAKSAANDIVINFGGQIAVRGIHEVTVADPRDRRRPLLTLTLHDESISTTSGSEKAFTVGERAFTHIIDPRTGEALPRRGSVSVIDRSALRADALSTALYVIGPDAGPCWAEEHHIRAIFINESGEIQRCR